MTVLRHWWLVVNRRTGHISRVGNRPITTNDPLFKVIEVEEAGPNPQGAVAKARADQREATIRHAAEFLDTLGRADLARALTNALGGGQ